MLEVLGVQQEYVLVYAEEVLLADGREDLVEAEEAGDRVDLRLHLRVDVLDDAVRVPVDEAADLGPGLERLRGARVLVRLLTDVEGVQHHAKGASRADAGLANALDFFAVFLLHYTLTFEVDDGCKSNETLVVVKLFLDELQLVV